MALKLTSPATAITIIAASADWGRACSAEVKNSSTSATRPAAISDE